MRQYLSYVYTINLSVPHVSYCQRFNQTTSLVTNACGVVKPLPLFLAYPSKPQYGL